MSGISDVSMWASSMDTSVASFVFWPGARLVVNGLGLTYPVSQSGRRYRALPRRIECFGWRRRLDIVLAVHPQSLDDFQRVLLMLVHVGVCSSKERG